MESQKELIEEKEWKILIILDACRYDFFSRIYQDYFKGNLRKVVSEGVGTPSWLRNTFRDKQLKNTTYISANPHINSLNVEITEGFIATNHFHKIVDVWDFGWDDDVGGVPPAKVTKNLRHSLAKNPRNKFIAHFNQPHIPYLSLELTQEMNTESEALKRARKGIAKKKNFVSSIRHFIG
ncbi:hypothetical protein AKJ38_01755 [candidate division MSBL1 archaeon SCGC-AAA259I14]|uniref:Sulfatase N-terminal domain-containing protein n=1 Tax=candidate division MSBL1 archaeon SCGC-AAA259I14 TaxID=1698268 RepID=A0A133USJ2_9EURY|nr:hypothetical protein AKJ38_01755 [candidate division MSBL1 archaeon SCGC-AAA259I14]